MAWGLHVCFLFFIKALFLYYELNEAIHRQGKRMYYSFVLSQNYFSRPKKKLLFCFVVYFLGGWTVLALYPFQYTYT